MARIFSFLLCVYNYLKMRRDFVMFFLSVFRARFPAAADVCFILRTCSQSLAPTKVANGITRHARFAAHYFAMNLRPLLTYTLPGMVFRTLCPERS